MQFNAPSQSEESNPMAFVKEPGKLTDPIEKQARTELVYEWTALYKDGSSLSQYDDEKQLVHHFGHIDQEKIYELVLESRRGPELTLSVNLEDGLFYLNRKPLKEVYEGKTRIPLGLSLKGKKVVSPWGNKAKLIYTRVVKRDFHMGTGTTTVEMVYKIGWEAKVDGKQEKHVLLINEKGRFALPPVTPEAEGFEAL